MFDIFFELKEEIFNKKEFYELCAEKGFLLALLLMFICFCFYFILFVFLLPFLPFYFINKKSKEYFSKKL